MQKKIVVPYAPILVESTRSIGYSFEAAVADIIDNSISASATEVRVCFSSQAPQWLCVEDDGWGMSKDKLTVMTKKNGVFSAACWDLDYIIHQKDWALQFFSEEEMDSSIGYLYLKLKESGTVVVWEQFDRLQQGASQVQKAFDEKIELTRKHVSLVFHR